MVLKQANPEGQLVSFPDANLRINQDFHKQLSLRKSLFKVRILKKKKWNPISMRTNLETETSKKRCNKYIPDEVQVKENEGCLWKQYGKTLILNHFFISMSPTLMFRPLV